MISKTAILTSIMLLISIVVNGQQSGTESNPQGKTFGLFINEEPIDMTLKFDMTTYFRKKPVDEFLKAEFIFHTSENDSISHHIKLKTRGEFRHRECFFAPIELNLKKVDLGYTDLDSISKLKLVTQCGYGDGDGADVLEEYLVYKLLNAMTDTSFRVRLVRATYIDTGREVKTGEKASDKPVKRKPIKQWAFFLEPNEVLARRINAVQIKTATLTQKNIFPYVMDRLALFNYMVGNYDWSIPGQHNVKVFKCISPTVSPYVIAIPYDFDWTGIVNAPYALPVEETGLHNVRERLFTGLCRTRETYRKQLDVLASKKNDFYKIINDFEYLKPREKNDLINFLDTFFDELEGDRSRFLDQLINSCKNL